MYGVGWCALGQAGWNMVGSDSVGVVEKGGGRRIWGEWGREGLRGIAQHLSTWAYTHAAEVAVLHRLMPFGERPAAPQFLPLGHLHM